MFLNLLLFWPKNFEYTGAQNTHVPFFFFKLGKFPGVGTHKLSKCPGVGKKKEGKCPAHGIVAFQDFQHFCSFLLTSE